MDENTLKERIFNETDVGQLADEIHIQESKEASNIVRVSGSQDLAKILNQMNGEKNTSGKKNVTLRFLTGDSEHNTFQKNQIEEELNRTPYIQVRESDFADNSRWNIVMECDVLTHWIDTD